MSIITKRIHDYRGLFAPSRDDLVLSELSDESAENAPTISDILKLVSTTDMYSIVNVATSTVVTASGYYLVDTTSGAVILTIPDGSAGMLLSFHLGSGSNPLTIVTASGGTSQTIQVPGQNITMLSDGTDWYVIQDSRNVGTNVIEYFRTPTDDGVVAGYKLFGIVPYQTDVTTDYTITTDGQLLGTHITQQGYPALSSLVGTIECYAYTNVNTTSGVKSVSIEAKYYKRNAAGTETLIGTSIRKLVDYTAVQECNLSTAVDVTLDPTDRIVAKIYAYTTGSGGNPILTSYIGGSYPNRIAVPASTLPSNLMYTNTYDTDADGIIDIAALPPASTSAKGIVELATSSETAAGLAVQASDTRLSDARIPTAHAASHQSGGADAVALDAAQIASGALAAARLPVGTLKTDAPISSTAQYIKDKAGNASVLAVSNNKIGIGTASPGAKLEVNSGAGDAFIIRNGASASPFIVELFDNNIAGAINGWSIKGWPSHPSGWSSGPIANLISWHNNYPTSTGKLTLMEGGGNVGIGTPSPGAKLHVNGAIRCVLPTSSSGLSSGDLWNDSGTVKIVT